MTDEGWEIVIRAGVERLAMTVPEDTGGGVAAVGDGRLWAVLWVTDDGGVMELHPPSPAREVAHVLWDVWSRARELREHAVTN